MKPVARKILLAALILPLAFPALAQDAAADRQELEALRQTTMKLIEIMVQSGIITQEKAETLLREARRNAALATAPAKDPADKEKVVRVPYVPQFVRDNMKEEIRQEVVAQAKQERWGEAGALPEWLNRFKFYGDVRLRYQANQLSSNNGPYINAQDTNTGNGLVLLNTTDSWDLWRFRARLGFDADVAPGVKAGLRMATGSNSNPGSGNQTLGNTFTHANFAVDRAFIQLDPYSWLRASGGRVENPFLSSDLVFADDDLNFEGVYAKFKPRLNEATELFLTVGAFPLEKTDCTNAVNIPNCGRDKWLYAAQAGFERALVPTARLKFGLAYYDFSGVGGSLNDPVVDPLNRGGIVKYMQRGNSFFNIVTNGGNPLLGLASDYREVDLTGVLTLTNFDPIQITVLGDYVKNIGYDADKIRQRTNGQLPIVAGKTGSEFDARTTGYQAKLTVGNADFAKIGNWQVFGGYKYVERDAVLDGFNDQDFHLGGTDAKGYILGGGYSIANNTWVRLRWLSANEIDGPPLSIDVLQVDLNAKF
jgi:Putative porin